MSDDILRQEIDGIEYFTIASTGESGMSQRGLSRLCGMQLRAIQNILENLTKNTAPQWLQKLVGSDLYLTKKTADTAIKLIVRIPHPGVRSQNL